MSNELYYIKTNDFKKLQKDPPKIKHLELYAAALRINVLYMIQQAGHGHIGSAFSALDIILYLYKHVMTDDDIFISSKGHDCAALYAYLISVGIIPEEELHNFRQEGGMPGHPDIKYSGIATNTGSLGMGLSKAQGLAIAKKRRKEDGIIYVLVGDGELQEGQNFEALRNIAHRHLDNIVILVDQNEYQCNDRIINTSRFTSMLSGNSGLFSMMGFYFSTVWEASSFEKIQSAFLSMVPYALNTITFKTKKGQGLPDEGNNKYHAGAMKYEEYKTTIDRLYSHSIEVPPNGRLSLSSLVSLQKIEKKPRMRISLNIAVKHYSDMLEELMLIDEKILILDADLYKDCGLAEIKKKYPDRFYQFGISEQDMVSAAGGLALAGYIPIVHSFAAFLCRRANEQIYNNCTEGTKIIYVGAFAGKLPPGPGVSHECVNDMDIMGNMPDMISYNCNGAEDLSSALSQAICVHKGPVYISLPCQPRRNYGNLDTTV